MKGDSPALPDVLHIAHEGVLHVTRSFFSDGYSIGIEGYKMDSLNPYIWLADKYAEAMSSALGKEKEDIHCTIKVCSENVGKKISENIGEKIGNTKVWTYARSESANRHGIGPEHSYEIRKNTALASLLACPDVDSYGKEINHWPEDHTCFCCGDLTDKRWQNLYQNSKSYHKYISLYKSVLTFPIRYPCEDDRQQSCFAVIGFLTFDSLVPNIFEVPCTFEYIKDPNEYKAEIRNYVALNMGCLIADTLGMCTAIQQLKTILA
jgi:hypothetical protein